MSPDLPPPLYSPQHPNEVPLDHLEIQTSNQPNPSTEILELGIPPGGVDLPGSTNEDAIKDDNSERHVVFATNLVTEAYYLSQTPPPRYTISRPRPAPLIGNRGGVIRQMIHNFCKTPLAYDVFRVSAALFAVLIVVTILFCMGRKWS